MAEESIATPGSAAESTPARTPATKDKACPYCGQAFTSSSLGRHLDLYIKERNPKPPDGIHNVEEIRQLRGGITRRQARNSSVRGGSSTPAASSKQSPTGPSHSPELTQLDNLRDGRNRTRLNESSWQSTGVIRDIPALSRDASSRTSTRRDVSRNYDLKTEAAQRQKMRDDLDTGAAAQLALQEVLESLKKSRKQPPTSPLDFDPSTMTFPALILRCLPSPPTLHTTHPFPTAQSWSLEPPGHAQLETLTRWFKELYANWRMDKTTNGQASEGAPTNGINHVHSDVNGTSKPLGWQEEEKLNIHLVAAHKHWNKLPAAQKQELWQLEILRAFSREQELKELKEAQLEKARLKIHNLQAQVATLTKGDQTPQDMLGITIAMSSPGGESANSISSSSATAPQEWNYEGLVAKWKGVVQNSRGLAAQRALPETPQPALRHHRQGISNNLTPSQPPPVQTVNGSTTTNGISTQAEPQPQTTPSFQQYVNGEQDEDEELGDADAEGEDAEVDAEGEVEADADGDVDVDVDAEAEPDAEAEVDPDAEADAEGEIEDTRPEGAPLALMEQSAAIDPTLRGTANAMEVTVNGGL